MAHLLKRIGHFSYHRRKTVLAAWIVILVVVGLSAWTFMGRLTNNFTLPGTETERVLDLMAEELPELSAGMGTVIFVTDDGEPFTSEQEDAITAALDDLSELPSIAGLINPFETQAELDSASRQVSEGEEELAAGEEGLRAGEEQIADGRRQIAEAKKKLAEGEAEIAANEPTLREGRAALEEGRAQLDAAAAQLASGKAQLDAGEAQLASGRAQLRQGEAQYAAGQQQIADGERQIAAAREEIAVHKAEIAEFDAGVAQLTQGLQVSTLDQVPGALTAAQTQIDQGTTQAQEGKEAAQAVIAELSAAQEQLEAGIAQLEALQAQLEEAGMTDTPEYAEVVAQLEGARFQLAQVQGGLKEATAGLEQAEAALAFLQTQQAQLNEAKAAYQQLSVAAPQVEQGRQEIAAAETLLNQKAAELARGKQDLRTAAAQLESARQQIAAAEQQLAAGRAEYESGLAQYQQGRAEFEANEAQLIEGEAALAQGKLDLEEGRQQISANEKKLDEGEADLEEGRQELAEGRIELERGARTAALSSNLAFVSADNNAAMSQISFAGQANALTEKEREEIFTIGTSVESVGVTALFSQEVTSDLNSVFGVTEVIGFLVAAIVLFFVLGTLLAAGLPLLIALFGVAIGVGGTLALSSLIEMQAITPVLALMLGLAVGIDYSLFIVYRHRTQLLAGMAMDTSVATAIATSGTAVVFAGLTVVIALTALVVPGLPFLSILGLSAAFTVLMVVLLSITLTPALLGFLGERVLTKKARAQRAATIAAEEASGDRAAATMTAVAEISEKGNKASRWWSGIVTHNSWIAAACAVLLLATLAIPAAFMQTALPDGGSEPEGSDAQQSFVRISEEFGEGFNGPLLIMAEFPAGLSQEEADDALLDVAEEIVQFDNVHAVVPVITNESLTYGALQVIPTTGPSSASTERLVQEIRDARDDIRDTTTVNTSVTGMVAAQIDISAMITAALPPYLVIVVGLSLILLLLVFRSLAIPLIATVGFLLSLAAAFGVTVAVYQWGWVGGLFGVHNPGPVLSFLPILLTGILFGLAMDYQVFLVTAMREAYVHGNSARRSIRIGFNMAAPVVVAAALIMVSVFAGFIFSHLAMIRPLGFGLAMGVLFDAFLVRMTFMPAVMEILGDKAWYLPRWLERIVPKVDVEGSDLGAEGPAAVATPTQTPAGTARHARR